MSGIRLIVGLGNPGADYEHTRHNAGAWFALNIAHTEHLTLRHESKFHGLHNVLAIQGQEVHILIPTTFMNLSGRSVQALAHFYKIPPAEILIAHDEIDIPVGDVRLKFDGGHGGHNGLRDIIKHLNTNQFHRLRIGVGHPGISKEVENYVLKPPRKDEMELIDEAMQQAKKILPPLIRGQFQQAMHQLHSREK